MKKAIIITLAFVLIISLAACGNFDGKDNSSTPNSDNSISEENDNLQIGEEDLSLSGILYEYTFKLEGDTITLPLTLEKLQSYGWELSKYIKLPDTVNAHTRLLVTSLTKDGKDIDIEVANINDEELPSQECMVYSIKSSSDKENYPLIELPKGIILGKSNKVDVIKAFGGPTRMGHWEENNKDYLIYESESFGLSGGFWGPSANEIEIITSNEKNNIITKITITNISPK